MTDSFREQLPGEIRVGFALDRGNAHPEVVKALKADIARVVGSYAAGAVDVDIVVDGVPVISRETREARLADFLGDETAHKLTEVGVGDVGDALCLGQKGLDFFLTEEERASVEECLRNCGVTELYRECPTPEDHARICDNLGQLPGSVALLPLPTHRDVEPELVAVWARSGILAKSLRDLCNTYPGELHRAIRGEVDGTWVGCGADELKARVSSHATLFLAAKRARLARSSPKDVAPH